MAKKKSKYANMDRATALKLAADLLHSFGESSLYDDYAADEGFTVDEFDAMIAELRKGGPWSIVYEADGDVYSVGPYTTEGEALAWAKSHNGTGVDSEFDANDQHVYIVGPDHRMVELSGDDLDNNVVEVEGGVFTFDPDGEIRYQDNHGNSEGVWRPGEPEYDQYKAQYFPTNEIENEEDEQDDLDDDLDDE